MFIFGLIVWFHEIVEKWRNSKTQFENESCAHTYENICNIDLQHENKRKIRHTLYIDTFVDKNFKIVCAKYICGSNGYIK